MRGASYGGVGAGGAAQDRGGKGGNSACNYYATNGSAGNPSGNNASCQYSSASGSNNGTGGVIVIFVRGTVSGSGVLDVRGQPNWAQGSGGGRGSGQGSAAGMISVFCDTYSGSGITLKRENGAYWNHDGGRSLTGDGTDDTLSGSDPTARGGTKGGFGKIQATTLT